MNTNTKTFSIISYFSWVGWFVALLMSEKDDKLVRHHLNQALVINIIASVGIVLTPFIIGGIIDIAVLVLGIMGIVRAANLSDEPLPIIGKIHLIGSKEQDKARKELSSLLMEEKIEKEPEEVKYRIVNNLGKILDVYENKVVFTFTVYYKDAVGVQYEPSSTADGYIQIETAADAMTSASSQYGGENSIQFSEEDKNKEAELIVTFIRKKIEEIKNAPAGGIIQQISPVSPAEELKKFKELLDMGAITQEEFDAKKKQLLGL